MKILAIDCGNTRIKYTLLTEGMGETAGVALQDAVSALPAHWQGVLRQHGEPERIVVSNVAGDAIGDVLMQSLRQFAAQPTWVTAQARQCGVVNRYDQPEKLGSDRWAAAIGAWNLERDACLVVNAGTATTVDALSADGEFLGGLILPGLSMMRESLAARTAGLPLVQGEGQAKVVDFPRNTADAIFSGSIAAQTGAIERMWKKLPASATCLLSGGAAHELYPALNMPCLVVDNLVLEGLLLIAREP